MTASETSDRLQEAVAPSGSVVICTRNRAEALALCLKALSTALDRTPGWEVVVVDNGSTDGTPGLLEAFANERPGIVRLLRQSAPGLARARNTAIGAARGDILAMTDDDCHVAPDYLAQIERLFRAHPAPLLMGGRIELGDPADLPVTIKTLDEPAALGPRQAPAGFLMGANMILNRAALDRIGPFDEAFGAGAPYRSGEDTDFVYRARSKGVAVRYTPEVVVHHYHGRRREDQMRDLEYGYNFGEGALLAKHCLRDRAAAVALAKFAWWALRDVASPGKRRRAVFKAAAQARGFLSYGASRLTPPFGRTASHG